MKMTTTLGPAQGSILRPDLWNIFYDMILRKEMLEGTFLDVYADDLAAVIIARDADKTQFLLKQEVRRVRSWMHERGHNLAPQKTEIVLLTEKRITTFRSIKVGDVEFQIKRPAKYLRIKLDNKLTFEEHTTRASDKAANISSLLSRLMANTTGL